MDSLIPTAGIAVAVFAATNVDDVFVVANGGDNLGVYVPLFASSPAAVPVFAVVFTVMTGVWCALGYSLVNNRWSGAVVRRYGQALLPVVLIAVVLYVLSGALEIAR